MESPLEVLSRAATCMQEHDGKFKFEIISSTFLISQKLLLVAVEISKLPAKKLYTRLNSHQNVINNHQQQQQQPSSISIIPINMPHSTTTSSPGMVHKNDEPMDQDDDEEINVHDDDSPLDMRITKQHDSDSDSVVRPSVIRRAPSFKETSNSPNPTSSTCDPFIDEHFRRSLDLASQAPPPLKKQVIITETHDDDEDTNDMSVDDHFAKALGDTWKKIQKESQ
ncbi:unnamed protein product [Diamesa serratosioi]